MEKAHLKYKGLGYRYVSTNIQIGNFACFLENECAFDSSQSFYIRWALDPKQDVTCGNINQLIKYKGNIYISDFDDEFELDEHDNLLPTGVEYEYKISIENFIKALERWGEIVSQDPLPQEIIITQDDLGSITFETKF